MNGSDLTLLVAFAGGVISFLSPCVLPLVPAYLGQLTTVAVTAGAGDAPPSRWLAVRHAAAYVLGFGTVFTLLGVTATFAAGPLSDAIPTLRTAGGVLLVALGLNMAGILPIPILDRTWRPLEAGAASARAGATGTLAFQSPGGFGRMDRLGGRLVASRFGPLTSFGLGVVFAVGWTPCIGVILGGILTLAASSGTVLQGGLLLLAYTAGLGVPFLALGVVYDRAPQVLRPLVRHGRAVAVVGGLLVVALGVAMIMDLLTLLPRYVSFNAAV